MAITKKRAIFIQSFRAVIFGIGKEKKKKKRQIADKNSVKLLVRFCQQLATLSIFFLEIKKKKTKNMADLSRQCLTLTCFQENKSEDIGFG